MTYVARTDRISDRGSPQHFPTALCVWPKIAKHVEELSKRIMPGEYSAGDVRPTSKHLHNNGVISCSWCSAHRSRQVHTVETGTEEASRLPLPVGPSTATFKLRKLPTVTWRRVAAGTWFSITPVVFHSERVYDMIFISGSSSCSLAYLPPL